MKTPEDSKNKRGRPKGSTKVYHAPNSPEANKEGGEMYNMIMGKMDYSKYTTESERVKTTRESMKEYYARIAREYLKEHPEELIKIRDEGLIQEMVDFAAKQRNTTPLAINDVPTEEEVYLAKREAEGKPLVIWEEAGDFANAEQIAFLKSFKEEEKQLDNSFNKMTDEAQEKLIQAIEAVNNALHNHPSRSDWDVTEKEYNESKARIKTAIAKEKEVQKEIKHGSTTYPMQNFDAPKFDRDVPATEDWNVEYVGGHDPIDDGNSRVNIARVHADGTVEYLNKKGDTIRTFKDTSLIKEDSTINEEPVYYKENYKDSMIEVHARRAAILAIFVCVCMIIYMLWG